MSSPKSGKESARARAAEIRAAQARSERRGRLLLAGGAIGGVVIVVVALVAVKLAGGGSSTPDSAGSSTAGSQVIRDVTSVPAATFDKVGVGTAQAAPNKISAPPVSADGKPKVLYIGAEYCPYCAAQRWPVVVALSRFGKWSNLGSTASASQDVFPSTATLSFHGASFSSDYLSFTGVETTSNKAVNGGYAPLDTPSKADEALFTSYNKPPYVSGQAGSIPFIDIAGEYVSSGASYSPQLLQGKTHAQIAAALADPSSPIAQAVDGSANLLTAALCNVTGGKPNAVCTAPGVTKAASRLTSGK